PASSVLIHFSPSMLFRTLLSSVLTRITLAIRLSFSVRTATPDIYTLSLHDALPILSGAKLDFQTHSRSAILKKLQSDMEFAVQWMPVSTQPGIPSKGAGDHLLTKIYLANMEFDKAIESASRVINGPYKLMTERFGIDAADPRKNVIWDLHRPENKNISQNTETILAFVDR